MKVLWDLIGIEFISPIDQKLMEVDIDVARAPETLDQGDASSDACGF